MGQFVFPETANESVLAWLGAISDLRVDRMERFVDKLPDSTWHNYRCSLGRSVVLVSISEHSQMAGAILVTVSTDVRRVWRIARLFGDVRLARRIAAVLKRYGGTPLED